MATRRRAGQGNEPACGEGIKGVAIPARGPTKGAPGQGCAPCLGELAASRSEWRRPAPASSPEETLGDGVGIAAGHPEAGRRRGGRAPGKRACECVGGPCQQTEHEGAGAGDQDLGRNADQR